MKRIFLIIFIISFIPAFAQSPVAKISAELKSGLESGTQGNKILVWIYFSDKGVNAIDGLSNPKTIVSKKSLERRSKVLSKTNLVDFTDLPIDQNYINVLRQNGFVVKQKSKWFNAVSGYATLSEINSISSLSFVKKIDIVKKLLRRKDDVEFQTSEINLDKSLTQPEGILSFNYGSSFTQLSLSNIPQVHDLGYTGKGVTICLMDAGFDNLQHEVFSNMNIVAQWDFVNSDSVVANQNDMGEGSHGTATLSIIGGYKEGQLIGPAFGANYLLAKTENTDSETPIEEDNWIAALEWADSIGVDVTSTSLGYLTYDSPYTSYTWENMDGNTASITIAADLAVKKGIVVVNSAGNEGFNSTHNTLGAPADGDSVISVGSVSSNGVRSYFSSVGPTADGRIKPDVMAMGSNDYHASSVGNSYSFGSGTSYSCPIVAGVCALLLEKNPKLTPMEVLQTLKSTSSQSSNPDNLYGWGIINAYAALNSIIADVKDTKVVDDFYLLTNYPNPFNPVTTIRYTIPEKNFVTISVYNILGDEVSTIFNGEMEAGVNEIKFDGSSLAGGLSSGVYFVRLISSNVQKTLKISLIK
ncbi:MAG TPA: S8 family serine peptidase [Ignavibacteriaceae bacterium]|nr:S8 family serine peptidase [Ignavibacteriaceae bacterium]